MKNKNFIKDIGITTVGQIALMLFAFGINKVVCIFLSVPDFAIYNIVRRTASVATYGMLMAMGIAIPKYLSEKKAQNDNRGFAIYLMAAINITVFASLVIAVGMVFLKEPLAALIFSENSAQYQTLIAPMVLYAVSCAFTTFVYSYYRAVGAYIRYSISQLAVQLGMLLVCLVAKEDLAKMLWIWGIGCCVYSMISTIIFVKRNCKHEYLDDKKENKHARKELLEYGAPRVPGEIVLFAYNLIPLLIISRKFGLVNASYFSAATSINAMITSLFSFVGVVLLPEVSKCVVEGRLECIGNSIRTMLIVYTLIAISAITFVEVFPKLIIYILFQEEYYKAIPMIRILVISIFPNALYLLYRNPLDGISKYPYNTVCLTASFALLVAGLLLSTSMLMCEVMYIVSYVLLGALCYIIWKKQLNKAVLMEKVEKI